MNADELRARQAPLKAKYRADARAAQQVLRAHGTVDQDRVACEVGGVTLGLHPATGGDGTQAC